MNAQEFKVKLENLENCLGRKLDKNEISIAKTIFPLTKNDIVEIEIKIGPYDYKFLAIYLITIDKNDYRFSITKNENYDLWSFPIIKLDYFLGWILKGEINITTLMQPKLEKREIIQEFLKTDYQLTVLNIKKINFKYSLSQIHEFNKDFHRDLVELEK